MVRVWLVNGASDTVNGADEQVIVDHDGHAQDELCDLDLGDVLLPPDSFSETKGGKGVVVVHGGVDEHVCPCADVAVCAVVDVEEPGEGQGDDMVVYMEEANAVLAEDEEDGVDKLPHLADEEAEEDPMVVALEERIVAVTDHLAEGSIGCVAEDAKAHGDCAQERVDEHDGVMGDLQSLQGDSLTILHDLPPHQHEDQIHAAENADHPERRNGRIRNVGQPLCNTIRNKSAMSHLSHTHAHTQ